jgi:hypothetical protein
MGYAANAATWYPEKGGIYSLGAFGGRVVYGFDHSVENNSSYSLHIGGNAFAGWSEPGTVWVMQDENGNGQPDDTWYELAGSETGKPSAKQRYALAYIPGNSFIDNTGDSGSFPYTLYNGDGFSIPGGAGQYVIYTGTRLLDKTYTSDDGIIYNPGYEWGYVDDSSINFRISDAIQQDGSPADLRYVDFVRVQTAVFKYAGILGEISTETGIAYDYSMYH